MNKQYSLILTACKCTLAGICVGLVTAMILICTVFLLSSAVFAEETWTRTTDTNPQIENPYDAQRGTLLFYDENGLVNAPLLKINAVIKVSGMIARVRVIQEFNNPDEHWKEGIYVFPLPEDAAVDHMRMYIGDRIIEGQIKERNEAKKIYTRAKSEGKKTSLVEQERPNIFTTSVANIGPFETIKVEIEYQQIINYDDGEFSLRFPMVVGPRYIPGFMKIDGFDGSGWSENTDQVEDAARITPPVLHPKQGKINPVSIDIDLDSGFKLAYVKSPYHSISTENQTGTLYRIALSSGKVPADRDFVLTWSTVPGSGPQAALFKETYNKNEYALIMILPPRGKSAHIVNREVIFVIDTSGSMGGESIRQAQAALIMALKSLKNGDRFNIIQFNSYTSQLFTDPQPVTHASIRSAEYYVGSLQAQGGTEMAPAIQAALRGEAEGNLVRQVIFLTDGSVGNEDALFRLIESQLGNSRLFTIGIGSAPNSHFMNRAALFGRGIHTYIGKIDEVQEKMMELFNKIESPVLTDLMIDWPGKLIPESWPQKIPDLFLGDPLLITAKSTSLPHKLKVSGKIGDKNWKADISLKGGQNREGIHVMWARRKIAALMNQSQQSHEGGTIRDEILATALEHHLVSKYTSLVAVDITPSRDAETPLFQRSVPSNLPAGWEYEKVFGHVPSTATPATLYFISGMILLCLALFTKFTGKRIFPGLRRI